LQYFFLGGGGSLPFYFFKFIFLYIHFSVY
jgi:hypothetical protein